MIETLYPKEIWRQFRDTRYDISNLGRVRSTLRPDASGNVRRNQAGIMAQKLTAAGYNQVQIAGTWRNVHRMVARVGNVTINKENGNAFIVQQFMTLKKHDELVENHSNSLDN